jgi:uncharacterized membrane protein YhhN
MAILKKTYVFLIPVLFAIYSILAIFSYNVQAIRFADITWILIAVVLFGAGLTGLLFIIFRDRSKASLIATCWLVIFFSYGQIYNAVHKTLGAGIGRNAILLPIAFVLMTLSFVWIWKLARDLSWPITFFGGMVAILCIMTCYSLARYYISINLNKPVTTTQVTVPTTGNFAIGPNIYYIILDGHGRQDILQEIYGYNDSEFIKFLTGKGFFVAESSHSNYIQTELSLSSSLNMQYLDTIGLPKDSSASSGRTWLDGKIRDSLVRAMLTQQGYKVVSFNNERPTTAEDADIYYNFDTTPSAADAKKFMGANEIEQMFLSSTMGRVIADLGWFPKITNDQQQYKFHYSQTQYILDKLPETSNLPGKNFIFVHIIVPHPPFVFSANGSFIYSTFPYFSSSDGSKYIGTHEEYISGYRNQVEYIDKVMENLITGILAHSTPAPIIIIQGDHGSGAYLDWNSIEKTNLDERLSILNAYYFPGNHSSALYASITPVNSFRVLFNEYFGMTYPLLDDKSYYSTWDNPFDYIDVTNKLKK